MTPKALVIDDDPEAVEMIEDVLSALGHDHDSAGSLAEARGFLKANSYSYILLDIEFPARSRRCVPRIQNAENFLDTMAEAQDHEIVPVVILSNLVPKDSEHTAEVMRLATSLRDKGATDFIGKPFPTAGRTLDRVIKKVLGDNGTPGRRKRRRKSPNGKTPIRIPTGGREALSDYAEAGQDSLLNKSSEPNEPITLNDFMAKYCEKISKDRCRCRREALLAAARHKTITMPPLAERHKRGRAKRYFVQGLFDAWQNFREKGVILPELKAEYSRRLPNAAEIVSE